MKTYSLQLSDLTLNKNEIYLNLGFGGQTPDEQFVGMIDQMLKKVNYFCAPQAGYHILSGTIPDKKYLEINDIRIKVGPIITKYLTNSTHFGAFVVTAGVEFDSFLDQFRANKDVVSEFFAYSIGSEIAEATVRFVTDKITDEAKQLGLKITHSYSPGHCSWNVREQKNLFSLFPERPCGIELNESNLMFPIKSVSGLIGLGIDVKLIPYTCEICGMVTCFKRKMEKVSILL